MATYVGLEPLTIARTVTGTAVYVYAGQPAVGLDPEDAARLVKEGFLDVVEDDELPDQVPVADDPGDGTSAPGGGSEPTTQRPKNTAPKPDWLAFRGVPDVDAESVTKAQLQDDEFMDDWTRSRTRPGEVERADGTRSDTLRDAIDETDVVGHPGVVGQPVGATPDAS